MNFQIVTKIVQFLTKLKKIEKRQLKELIVLDEQREIAVRKFLKDDIEELNDIIEYVKDYYDL